MSGGGGGTVGGGGGPEPISCDIVLTGVVLQNVDPKILVTVKVGDRFDVELRAASPIATKNGAFVGSILVDVSRLVRCIREGHDYMAHVTQLDITTNRCVVTIRNA